MNIWRKNDLQHELFQYKKKNLNSGLQLTGVIDKLVLMYKRWILRTASCQESFWKAEAEQNWRVCKQDRKKFWKS